MKSKQKLEQTKQMTMADLQSPALKQQDLFTTLTAPLQESTRWETVGQTHTKKCIDCDVALVLAENWTEARKKQSKYLCKTCWNGREMYVDKKYISRLHPLYKAGRYKSFGDAAFESLENYSTAKEGQVYIMYSPAYPSWCKIGMAVDAKDRISSFQTGTPYRDYILVAAYDVPDRRKSETAAHNLLRETHASKNEWFVVGANVAKEILDGYFDENN
jgi:hypothetical protein